MSRTLDCGLRRFDRTLLRCVGRVVPSDERQEWSRTWHAELWYVRHAYRGDSAVIPTDLSIGMFRDALWMRGEHWRRTWVGTATLCLGAVVGMSLLAALVGVACTGNLHLLTTYLTGHLVRSLAASALVVFVSFATSSRGHLARNSKITWINKRSRELFLLLKIAGVLMLAFLLSADVSVSVYQQYPNTADFFQLLDFVVMALAGLRWTLRDQEVRCKKCLVLLTAPARVGRPSRNLLEWNGSEMNCKRGHGLLSVAEMETSWCDASRWIECVEC